MTKAILPDAILAQLPELNGQVELCNKDGQTLGFFLSPDIHREYLYAWRRHRTLMMRFKKHTRSSPQVAG